MYPRASVVIFIELQQLCIQVHTKLLASSVALASLSQPLSFSYGTRGAIRFYSGFALYRGSDPLTGHQPPKRLAQPCQTFDAALAN